MSLFSSYATDPEVEKNGVLVTYPDPDRKEPEAFRIKLARLTGRSSRYKQVKERLMKPYRGNAFDAESAEVQEHVNRQIFVEACILSWETKVYEGALVDEGVPCTRVEGVPTPGTWAKGVELRMPDGTDHIVPASQANICAALKMAPDFGVLLLMEANGADLYRFEQREADSGN